MNFLISDMRIIKVQGFQIHEKFERGEYIESYYVHQLVNYICGNLNCWTPNRIYWEEQYNYCNKLNIVIKWKIARESACLR